jgi:preprotein translocase subunit SecD
MNHQRRRWIVAAAAWAAGHSQLARAADADDGIVLTVRRLGRLPSNATALPAGISDTAAELARERGGWPWVAYREVLLSNADVVSAQVVPMGRDDADTAPHVIRLTLTPRASSAWGRATRELVEQDVGVFLDDRLQGGITIRTPISSGQFDFRVHRADKAALQRVAAGVMKKRAAPV